MGRPRRSRDAPPAGPSPPPGRPRPGRAQAGQPLKQSWVVQPGAGPGLIGARQGSRSGWGRQPPPHLDLPTPLSPMMRIFRVVNTSSSIPSARPAKPGPDRRSRCKLRQPCCACAPPPPLFTRPSAPAAHAPEPHRGRRRRRADGSKQPGLRTALAQRHGAASAQLFTASRCGSALAVGARPAGRCLWQVWTRSGPAVSRVGQAGGGVGV